MLKIKKKKPKVKISNSYIDVKSVINKSESETKDLYERLKKNYWDIHNILYDQSITLSVEDRVRFECMLKRAEQDMRKVEGLFRQYTLLRSRCKR